MVFPALIAAGGALVGGLINKKSQNKTNAANVASVNATNANNLQISRETNAWNAEQVEKQNAWNAEQIRLQNEYNSPANMRQMYEDAGFNPLIGVGMGTALQTGAAMGSPASGTAIPMIAPQRSASTAMGDAFANVGLLAADGFQKHQELLAANSASAQRLAALEKENAKLRLSPPQPSIVGQIAQSPSGVTVPQAFTNAYEDTRPPVELIDANSGFAVSVPYGVAQRLGLKDGDYLIGEDSEAILGDMASEIYTGGAIAVGTPHGNTAIRPSSSPSVDYSPERPYDFRRTEEFERFRRAVIPSPINTYVLPQRGR